MLGNARSVGQSNKSKSNDPEWMPICLLTISIDRNPYKIITYLFEIKNNYFFLSECNAYIMIY